MYPTAFVSYLSVWCHWWC